jgi:hypothetical protein
MTRKLLVLVATCAAFMFTAQVADAGQRKEINPTIRATDFWVGGAWTGAWLALAGHVPDGFGFTGTTIGCMATSPMVATVALNRPLTYREAHILMGGCVIPVIGSWLVNEAYNNGWLWAPDEKPVRMASHKKSKTAARPADKVAAKQVEMAAVH